MRMKKGTTFVVPFLFYVLLPPSFMRGVAEAKRGRGEDIRFPFCDTDSPLPLRGIPPHK